MKIKNNKKGFSLVELIVCVALIAIMAAFLVPSLTALYDDTNNETDDAVIETLSLNIQMALQQSSVYGDALNLSKNTENPNNSKDDTIYVLYKVEDPDGSMNDDPKDDGRLYIDSCYINKNGSIIKSSDSFDGVNDEIIGGLTNLKIEIEKYVNRNMDAPLIMNIMKRDKDFIFAFTFSDIAFKVDSKVEIIG